jgi:4-hydroxybenzoate polyprenyltransferase
MAAVPDPDISVQMSVSVALSSIGSQLAAAPGRALKTILDEVRITYQIVWRDLSASLIPATLFGLAALHARGEWTLVSVGYALLRCFAYFSLYIYTFCLCNQIVGYREDRVNKPDRVLPAKTITMKGAVARWIFAMAAFPLVGFALGGLPILGWAIAWQAIFLSYNFLGLHQHWFTKNTVFITLGTIVQLAPAWGLSAPLEPVAWRWILVVAASFGFTLHLQDLRDVQGDHLVGRRTLPIVIGQKWTRRLLAVGIGLLPLVTHFGLVRSGSFRLSVVVLEVALTLLNLVVAVRTLRLSSPQADHRTYILHTYWFCAVLASGIVVI